MPPLYHFHLSCQHGDRSTQELAPAHDSPASHRAAPSRMPHRVARGGRLLIDGQLFSPHLPRELRHPPAPPRGASERGPKIAYEVEFNQRARRRLVRHAGPDVDGVTRWRCPLCAGCCEAVKSQRP